MKNKSTFLIIFFLIMSIVYVQKANSKQNFSYTTYKPEYSQTISRQVIENSKDSNIIFIVDYSNSMNEQIDGKSKLDMARTAIAEILPNIPQTTKIGLRIYGYSTGFTYLQGCMSSKLAVPMGTNNSQDIMNNLYKTNAMGWTPITYSLKQAINKDLINIPGKKHIILLTDGGENCDESPCNYAIELMKTRDDVTIDVIAFDVHDIDANNQLRCAALVTSGKFLKADNENDLYNSLFKSFEINKDVKGSIKIPTE